MTIVNDTLFFEDGLAGMAFMMEMEEETGEGNVFPSSSKNSEVENACPCLVDVAAS